MNATQMNQEQNKEQISAWLDGELSDAQIQVMLKALESDDAKISWDMYHQIGDVLRSDELAIELSPDFSRKMAQMLAAEPHYLLPAMQANAQAQAPDASSHKAWRQRLWSGMAVAAGLLVVVNIAQTPGGNSVGNPAGNNTMAGSNAVVSNPALARVAASSAASASQSVKLVASPGRNGEYLRDPEIDQYLSAHQRFSPSVYSAAQYARPTSMKKTGTDK
ncbi:MAG: hypothetical protein RL748_2229 [Pseudomonadota bacterium]|jgi:sigma-E factor negative regulatory protein RseA